MQFMVASVTVLIVYSGTGCLENTGGTAPRQDAWVHYRDPDPSHSTYVNDIALDPQGGLWLATGGIVQYLDHRGTLLDLNDDRWTPFTDSDGLLVGVLEVHVDANGGKWFIGQGGVSYLDDQGTPGSKLLDMWRTYTVSNGLPSNDVNTAAIDGQGGKWLGFAGVGAAYWDDNGTPLNQTDDRWSYFSPDPARLRDGSVRAIAVEPGKGVWFGHFSGLDFLDFGGTPLGQSDDNWANRAEDDGLVWPWVECIAIDSSGRKWIGTYDGAFSCLDDGGTPLQKATDLWATFAVKRNRNVLNELNDLAIDRTGPKWIASRLTGVYFVDDKATPFDKSDDRSFFSRRRNGLHSYDKGASVVVIDQFNGKWVGTSAGLNYLP